jgi:hypothetical protein
LKFKIDDDVVILNEFPSRELEKFSIELMRLIIKKTSRSKNFSYASPYFENSAKTPETAKSSFLKIAVSASKEILDNASFIKTKLDERSDSYYDSLYEKVNQICQNAIFIRFAYEKYILGGAYYKKFISDLKEQRISMRRKVNASLYIPPENYKDMYKNVLDNGFGIRTEDIENLNSLNETMPSVKEAAEAIDKIASVHKTVTKYLSTYRNDLSPDYISEMNSTIIEQRESVSTQLKDVLSFLDLEANRIREAISRLESIKTVSP